MNIEFLKQGKNEVELKMDNILIAEILRVYLNKSGIKFAAWKKEHPTKPITFRVESESGTVKKAISDAVSAIKKDLTEIQKTVKK